MRSPPALIVSGKQLATRTAGAAERLTQLFAGQQLLNFERSLRRYLSQLLKCRTAGLVPFSIDPVIEL
jgi:hypothetical protein